MSKFKDRTNEKHGRLTVIEFAGWYYPLNDNRTAKWRCLCECGNEVVVIGKNLGNNHTTSCGCQHVETFTSDKNPMKDSINRKKISESRIGMKFSEEHIKHLSESHKGLTLSEESRRKLSEAISGDKHYNWQGGKSFEDYPPEFSKWLKNKVITLHNNECVICGRKDMLHVHHIDYNKNNCSIDNLIPLCVSCHSKTNFNRPYWTELFKQFYINYY